MEEQSRLRCKHGLHLPINERQAKPFLQASRILWENQAVGLLPLRMHRSPNSVVAQWFDSCGVGGFRPYDKSKDGTLGKMVEGILERAFKKGSRFSHRINWLIGSLPHCELHLPHFGWSRLRGLFPIFTNLL
jgi:hypothetical protein